jgi:hypothetical protein
VESKDCLLSSLPLSSERIISNLSSIRLLVIELEDGMLVVRVLAGLEVSELSVDSMLLALPGIGLSLPIEESHVVALDRRAGVFPGVALDLKLSLLKEDDPITSPDI